jgi:hypothetical protein
MSLHRYRSSRRHFDSTLDRRLSSHDAADVAAWCFISLSFHFSTALFTVICIMLTWWAALADFITGFRCAYAICDDWLLWFSIMTTFLWPIFQLLQFVAIYHYIASLFHLATYCHWWSLSFLYATDASVLWGSLFITSLAEHLFIYILCISCF